MSDEGRQAHIENLRRYRNRPERDQSLGFLREQFKRQVERPHKQLAKLVCLWAELVPDDLARHTRLDSLNRGVLRVAVDSSARLYELDRLLRGGLQQQLIRAHPGPAIRKVQLHIQTWEASDGSG
jgi:predicted nucleic acid-binding Zn ribbon protein